MTAIKLKTGGEVDAYCTKCKLDLNHRIVAMVEGQPKRVECSTCNTQHNYYRPKGAATAKVKKEAKPRSERASSLSSRAKAAQSQEQMWEKLVSGQPPRAFQPYRITTVFEVGHLVHHTKYGDGVVLRVLDRTKIEVLLKEGTRLLAHAMAPTESTGAE